MIGLGMVHVLPNTVIGIGRHALPKVGGRQRRHDRAHSRQIKNADPSRPLKGAGRRPHFPRLYQGLRQGKRAVGDAFLRSCIIT